MKSGLEALTKDHIIDEVMKTLNIDGMEGIIMKIKLKRGLAVI